MLEAKEIFYPRLYAKFFHQLACQALLRRLPRLDFSSWKLPFVL